MSARFVAPCSHSLGKDICKVLFEKHRLGGTNSSARLVTDSAKQISVAEQFNIMPQVSVYASNNAKIVFMALQTLKFSPTFPRVADSCRAKLDALR